MTNDITRRSLFFKAGALALAGPAIIAASTQAALAEDPVQAFFDGGFNDCNADKLAKFWNVSYNEAKERAGWKLINGERKRLVKMLTKAQNRFMCDEQYQGFNYKDSDILAEFWKHA